MNFIELQFFILRRLGLENDGHGTAQLRFCIATVGASYTLKMQFIQEFVDIFNTHLTTRHAVVRRIEVVFLVLLTLPLPEGAPGAVGGDAPSTEYLAGNLSYWRREHIKIAGYKRAAGVWA